MAEFVRLRALQAMMAAAYAALAAIALVRDPLPLRIILCAGVAAAAYLTGRSLPDIMIPREAIPRAIGIGLIVALVGAAVEMAGDPHALGWVSIAMACCAGNRLRAAGIGPAAH